MYDVVIVGGGPAGAALARLIGGRVRVLLLEKRPLDCDPESPRWRKACGGLIAPDARRAIAALGLGIPTEVLAGPQPFLVRVMDFDSVLERYYARMYLNVHRGRFDCWLLSTVPPSVELRSPARFRSLDRRGETLDVHYELHGHADRVRTRLLVGADGATSLVRRLAFPGTPTPPAYLAVQEWFHYPAEIPYYGAVFDSRVTDHYCWVVQKGRHLVIGAALRPGAGAMDRFRVLKEELSREFGLGVEAQRRESGILLRPTHSAQLCPGGGRVLLIGDAAGLASPSSGEGISFAFGSAVALAQAIERNPRNPRRTYTRLFRRLKARIALKILKAKAIFHPLWRSLIMRSGVSATRVVGPRPGR